MLFPYLAQETEFLERFLTFTLELSREKFSERANSITTNGATAANPVDPGFQKMLVG